MTLKRLAAALLLWPALSGPSRAEPAVTLLPLPFKVGQFRGPDSRLATLIATTDAVRDRRDLSGSRLVVVWGEGGGAVLRLGGPGVEAIPLRHAPDADQLERGHDAVPGSQEVARGPLTADLVEPTSRYRHGALGGIGEPASLAIAERGVAAPGGGVRVVPIARQRVEAGEGAVFEDRAPRIADLGPGASPAIVTVKSYLDRGSALAVIARRGDAWRVVAETPPIGEPQRWLNPAAIADFLGDGRAQIVLVRTPHRDGVLQLWELDGERLVLKAEKAGYANHAFGSPTQALAAVIVRPGAPPDLAIPTLDRTEIAILSFKGGIRETARIALPAAALTGVAVLGEGASTHILVGLESGQVADIRP